ncbi:tRNA (adenosine(37)-N6)-threonylcarbamoyltransferase complex dimerization subunit type 1 TsaB [Geosporobacter ferrireducens]|uniref:tRNA (Adenosine(37)-N6)-threonylcarbamoyltransferase complex dimerization subunit type 1 TsaB n=1 Tax=Geosporobacter ferrireducens TaxID=1424294 RepID=A0A1D8GGG8_9FIRM|nr:tRNA (adenosine(37)-N6)-threonylcarbamoyltransferase complex dimerization subunit type 1 TsaB [Geosporobacter ferrireducens]AOT69998.1 tRNA (adenosine(37)-N6)-threonylcarbamoyltransferase complex dimerization subunit type 1 TsaB [Geosporobacter ferrireducens]
MLILALDTSSIVASVALMDEEKLIGEYIINHEKTHSQKLMPLIEALLTDCEHKLEEVDVIAVAEGPGSFTGLRIGVATAKGLAHGLDKPVVGISTLDGLAFNMPYCEGLICPILDARRNQVYTAVYKWEDGMLNRIFEPVAVSIEALTEQLKQRPEKVVFLGDGVKANEGFLREHLGNRVLLATQSAVMQRASSIAELALQKAKDGKLDSFYGLIPEYLRKSEAERQYEEKMKRCDQSGGANDSIHE